jgi:DNA-binding HxlR family transcriptional regulator
MVGRTSLKDADCPVARSVDIIGDWWSLLIVRDAFDGVRRFSEFQKGLGVSKGILASRLRDLVRLGILQTTPVSDGSAYQDYVLTDKGNDLFAVVVALRQWGEEHCFLPGEPHSVLVEKETCQRVGRLRIRSASGQMLESSDTMVRKITSPPRMLRRPTGALRKQRKTASRTER